MSKGYYRSGFKKKTAKSFLVDLILSGEDYGCEVCRTKDPDVLTRHHKISQRFKKDNSTRNLVSLCRRDHDLVEKFYEWILKFNAPELFSKHKYVERKKKWLDTIEHAITHPHNGVPYKLLKEFNLDDKFFSISDRAMKLRIIKNIRREYDDSLNEVNNSIKNKVLSTVNWDNLYKNARHYARNKV